jgi:hypothetical protein
MRRAAPLLALFLPALVAAVPAVAAAQASPGATLVVHVVDEKGAPLAGASVAVRGLNRWGTTDAAGEARIAQIPQGNRVVEVRRQGYRSRRVPTAFTSGETVLRVVDLVPTAVELDTVAAVARANARNAPRSLLLVKVLDEKGAPIQGAYVTVGGVEHGESTDRNGEAKLAAIPQGNRLVEVKRQGYAYRRVAADFMGGDTVRKEVAMTPAPIELEGIVVTTWGRSMALVRNGFYDRQRRGFGAFMTRQRLDELRPYRTSEAFRYMRGFMVVPMGSTDVVVGSRGGGMRGGCLPAVYIDGMLMFVMNARDEADAINMVSPDDIEAIEAFQGAASIPAQYNPTGSACGVILIWTRR